MSKITVCNVLQPERCDKIGHRAILSYDDETLKKYLRDRLKEKPTCPPPNLFDKEQPEDIFLRLNTSEHRSIAIERLGPVVRDLIWEDGQSYENCDSSYLSRLLRVAEEFPLVACWAPLHGLAQSIKRFLNCSALYDSFNGLDCQIVHLAALTQPNQGFLNFWLEIMSCDRYTVHAYQVLVRLFWCQAMTLLPRYLWMMKDVPNTRSINKVIKQLCFTAPCGPQQAAKLIIDNITNNWPELHGIISPSLNILYQFRGNRIITPTVTNRPNNNALCLE